MDLVAHRIWILENPTKPFGEATTEPELLVIAILLLLQRMLQRRRRSRMFLLLLLLAAVALFCPCAAWNGPPPGFLLQYPPPRQAIPKHYEDDQQSSSSTTTTTSTSISTSISTITRRMAVWRQLQLGASLAGGFALPTTAAATNANSSSSSPPPSAMSKTLESRLFSDDWTMLVQPPVASASSTGIDATGYPSFLEGTWRVTQTLVSVQTPLGLRFAGGPNGDIAIATQSLQDSRARLNQPVSLQLRYVNLYPIPTLPPPPPRINQPQPSTSVAAAATPGVVVVEDRAFNTRQRLDAFAGKAVVARVEYANTMASNGAAMAQHYTANPGDAGMDDNNNNNNNNNNELPLTTTVTYFKGPAAQKTFVTAHHPAASAAASSSVAGQSDCSTIAASSSSSSSSSSPPLSLSWTGFECQRSLFALTNASTAPPITTDSELIFRFVLEQPECSTAIPLNDNNDNQLEKRESNRPRARHVTGRLRIVGYLNPNDALYFEARNRAVTVQDYTLDMVREE